MFSLSRKQALWVIFALALGLRVYHLALPFIEPYNNVTRQSVVAMVVRNYYQHGFNLFYPELDNNGSGPYLFNAELPINAYLMALGYRLAGGVHEWVARSVSVLFSMGALGLLYLLIGRMAGERMALFGLIFASLSPMNVALSRSIQPEATMIFGCVGALYMFARYQESHRSAYCVYSALFMALAVAVKPYVLYLFIPLTYLAWEKEKFKIFSNGRYYLYSLFVGSILIWYGAMWFLGRGQHLAYSTISYAHDRGIGYSSFWQILSYPYLFKTFKIFFIHVLTPVGAVFFLIGLFWKVKNKAEKFFYVWFFSVLFYMLVFWRTVIDHSYYQFPLVPVCAFFVAKGFCALWDSKYGNFLRNPLVAPALIALTLACLLHFYQGLYFIPKENMAVVQAGAAADRLTPGESLVVAAYEGSPIQLYYCNRKGWEFNIWNNDEKELIDELESLKGKGASFFVTSDLAALKAHIQFDRYLRTRFKVFKETDEFVIFRLV